jgi:hypothetical protein
MAKELRFNAHPKGILPHAGDDEQRCAFKRKMMCIVCLLYHSKSESAAPPLARANGAHA